jgi:hypothetical protein
MRAAAFRASFFIAISPAIVLSARPDRRDVGSRQSFYSLALVPIVATMQRSQYAPEAIPVVAQTRCIWGFGAGGNRRGFD